MTSALYVRADGPYPALVADWWDEQRDATGYDGAGPVVAHPPCACWGNYATWAKQPTKHLGPIAVEQVRRFGGVLEHPRRSKLWAACGMPVPGALPDRWGGWSIEVDQARWGHPCPKATWLYIVGRPDLPPLPPPVDDPGGRVEFLSRRGRELTPPAFAAWLVRLADGCRVP